MCTSPNAHPHLECIKSVVAATLIAFFTTLAWSIIAKAFGRDAVQYTHPSVMSEMTGNWLGRYILCTQLDGKTLNQSKKDKPLIRKLN